MKGCLYMTMTYEEVLEKIKSSGKVTITETKAAQNARVIKLSNGGIINCYNTGRLLFRVSHKMKRGQ